MHCAGLCIKNRFYAATFAQNKEAMKTHLLIFFFTLCGVLSPQLMQADHIPTKGKWGEEGYRSIIPTPPSISIEGHTLFVHFIDPLSNLTVYITDERGEVICQEVISAETPGNDYAIPLNNASSGDYQITLIHYYGALSGSFLIE